MHEEVLQRLHAAGACIRIARQIETSVELSRCAVCITARCRCVIRKWAGAILRCLVCRLVESAIEVCVRQPAFTRTVLAIVQYRIHSAGPDIGICPQIVARVDKPGPPNSLQLTTDLARTPYADN